MTRTQVQVTWKRVGNAPKVKRFVGLKRAERFLILLGPNPWLAFDKEPDDYVCCSGYQCGCGGKTEREQSNERREEMPPIEWIRVDRRTVSYSTWEVEQPLRTVTSEGDAKAFIAAHPERFPFLLPDEQVVF